MHKGIISTNNLTDGNGRWNWVAILFFVLLVISIGLQIVESFLWIRQYLLDKKAVKDVNQLMSSR